MEKLKKCLREFSGLTILNTSLPLPYHLNWESEQGMKGAHEGKK